MWFGCEGDAVCIDLPPAIIASRVRVLSCLDIAFFYLLLTNSILGLVESLLIYTNSVITNLVSLLYAYRCLGHVFL